MAAAKDFPGFFNATITSKIKCVYAPSDDTTGLSGTTTLIYMATEDGTHIVAFPDATERPMNNLMNMAFYDTVGAARKVWAKMIKGKTLLSKKILK